MQPSYSSLALSDLVPQDKTFACPSFTPLTQLGDSLQRCGILHPLWVWLKPDRTKALVDGFKRRQWAQENGIENIQCLLFPPETDPSELLLKRIEGKLFGPMLNVAERAQIIHKLAHNFPKAILDRYLPLLGISGRDKIVGKWLLLAGSSQYLLAAAALEEICERAALELATWEERSQQKALELLKILCCSASIQYEILVRIKEIALREEVAELAVLLHPELIAILKDSVRNRREKTQAIRDRLYRRRYPRLKAREDRFLQDLGSSHLPKPVRVLPPPSFEGSDWQLQIDYSNPEELRQLLSELQNFASSSEIEKMMKI
jgi:ParB family transcriptional regulator, chromosome partitioning protein